MTHENLKLAFGFVLIAAVLGVGAIVGFAPLDESRRTAIIEVTEPLAGLAGAFSVWAFARAGSDRTAARSAEQSATSVTRD